MKLADWPIGTIGVGQGDGEVQCEYAMRGEPLSALHNPVVEPCGMSFSMDAPEAGHNARTVFESGTLGELAQSIVEHAKSQHGIEIERTGSWYQSFTPDGKLAMDSSQASDFGPVDLAGMEGEELEHFAARNEVEKTLRYRRIGVYTVDVAEEWKP